MLSIMLENVGQMQYLLGLFSNTALKTSSVKKHTNINLELESSAQRNYIHVSCWMRLHI